MVCDDARNESKTDCEGLNPTFSGIWSATYDMKTELDKNESLNPTFSGIWSATLMLLMLLMLLMVLILLFLEYGLRQQCKTITDIWGNVLILLFLEYGLRPSRVPKERYIMYMS